MGRLKNPLVVTVRKTILAIAMVSIDYSSIVHCTYLFGRYMALNIHCFYLYNMIG